LYRSLVPPKNDVIAIYCGDYPYLGNRETCNAWNISEDYTVIYHSDEYDKNIGDKYKISAEKLERILNEEFTADVLTEVMEVAVTAIFILFILAIVCCVHLCRRKNVYKKYAILDNESANPGQ